MTTEEYDVSPRTQPTRNRQRVSYDRALVHGVLDEAMVCHVGFISSDGAPVVLPQLHVRIGDVLYLHGSTGARALRSAADGGLAVCATVTLLDGLVLARSAFHHSVNYRSVVVHGVADVVSDEQEKSRVLAALVDAMVPGRSAGTRTTTPRELAATAVLRLPLADVSVKVRAGDPIDDDDDLALPWWAGVLPVAVVPAAPIPAENLPTDTPVPPHVAQWRRGRQDGPRLYPPATDGSTCTSPA